MTVHFLIKVYINTCMYADEKMHSVLSQLQLDKANISNIWYVCQNGFGVDTICTVRICMLYTLECNISIKS